MGHFDSSDLDRSGGVKACSFLSFLVLTEVSARPEESWGEAKPYRPIVSIINSTAENLLIEHSDTCVIIVVLGLGDLFHACKDVHFCCHAAARQILDSDLSPYE